MSGEKDSQPGTIGLTIKTSLSGFHLVGLQIGKLGGNAKKKGLDVILDNPAVQCTQIDLGE